MVYEDSKQDTEADVMGYGDSKKDAEADVKGYGDNKQDAETQVEYKAISSNTSVFGLSIW